VSRDGTLRAMSIVQMSLLGGEPVSMPDATRR